MRNIGCKEEEIQRKEEEEEEEEEYLWSTSNREYGKFYHLDASTGAWTILIHPKPTEKCHATTILWFHSEKDANQISHKQ